MMDEIKDNQIDEQKEKVKIIEARKARIEAMEENLALDKQDKKLAEKENKLIREAESGKASEVRGEAEVKTKLDANAKITNLLNSIKNIPVDKEVAVTADKELSEEEIQAKNNAFHVIGKSLEIRVIYGYHDKYEDDVPAVQVKSKIIKGKVYTFFLEEINSRNKIIVDQIKNKIARIGSMNDSVWKLLSDKANSLFTIENIFMQVGVIEGIVTSKTDSIVKANYQKVCNFYFENKVRFASLADKDYKSGYHYGVRLDTPLYKKKYRGKDVIAITSSDLARIAFQGKNDAYNGKRSNKELHDFKETLQSYADWPTDNKENSGIRLTTMRKGDTAKERVPCLRISLCGKLSVENVEEGEE